MICIRSWYCFRWVIATLAVVLGVHLAMGQEAPAAAPGAPPPAQPGGLPPAIQPGEGARVLLAVQEKAAIIKLHGEVDDMMLRSLQRRLDIARKAGCTLVVYELDTYGGLLTSGLEISKLTRRLPADSHFTTVAWVNDKAYSAGTLIAVSCQHIVMARGASLGDCAPIAISGSGLVPLPATERAKFAAPLLEELDQSAAQNKYDRTILHAMVDAAIEIHEVEERKTGQLRYVDTVEKDKLTAIPPGEKESPWKYNSTVDSAQQLLTMGPDLAAKMGISHGTVSSEQELRAALNIRGDVITLDFSWAEVATVWLTSTWIRVLLFVAMVILGLVEVFHTGATVPGIAAIACLILLVGAPFLTGIAQVWEIVLIVLGLGIIVTDILIFGGVGLLAIPGFLLMAIGLIASFVPAEPGGGFSMPSTWHAMQTGMMVVVFGSMAAIGGFAFLSRYLAITPGFRRLQLAPAVGSSTAKESSLRDSADRSADEAVFRGAVGRAATDLRPAGKARFGDHLVDVVSFGSFIERNTEVEVVELSGNHVVVKPHAQKPGNPPSSSSGETA